jgi:hypothetical protein
MQAVELKAALDKIPDEACVLIDCGPMPVGPGRCDIERLTIHMGTPPVFIITVDPG